MIKNAICYTYLEQHNIQLISAETKSPVSILTLKLNVINTNQKGMDHF